MASWRRPITGPSAVPPNCFSRLLRDREMSTPAFRYAANCRLNCASWPELTRPKRIRSHQFGPSAGIRGFSSERVAQAVRLRLGLARLAGCRRRRARRIRAEGRGRDPPRAGGAGAVATGPAWADRAAQDAIPGLLDLDSSGVSRRKRHADERARRAAPDVGTGPRVLDPIVAPRIAPVKSRRMTVVRSVDGPSAADQGPACGLGLPLEDGRLGRLDLVGPADRRRVGCVVEHRRVLLGDRAQHAGRTTRWSRGSRSRSARSSSPRGRSAGNRRSASGN